MAVKPGQVYQAEVLSAAVTGSQNLGTPAISLNLETHDGMISHDLWVTPKTRERVQTTMLEVFGIDPAALTSESFISNIGLELTGKQCSITTIEEEYKGKKKVKVQWLNPVKKEVSGDIVSRAAALFAGKSADEVSEEDVPF